MSHYVKVVDGIVVNGIVADSSFFETFVDSSPGTWLQTSYNTRGGVHYGEDGEPDGGAALRGNYAGIGYTYDHTHDVFYAPKPYPSWTISAPTWVWQPPSPMPLDEYLYNWDEATLSWTQGNLRMPIESAQ